MQELIFNKIKIADLRQFRQKVWQDTESFLILPIEELGKLFFTEFQGNDIFNKYTFQEIRTKYIQYFYYDESPAMAINTNTGESIKVDLPEIPKKEKDFFAFICKKYLGFNKEPRLCLLELYQNAAEDIREIEERINKYQKEIENEKSKRKNDEPNKKQNIKKNNSDGYTEALIKHYIEVNENAKNEIIKFITTEDIKICAILEASKSQIFPQNVYRYSYRKEYSCQPSRYNKEKLSEIANKFLEFDHQKMQEIERLYRDKKNVESQLEFFRIANDYITQNNVIEKIRSHINENHFLYARKEILGPILDFYLENKLLFINLAPLQIEGIFHDYCVVLDVSEKLLKTATIGKKLEKIVEKNPNFWDFEYFKFIFPKTRNRVAHGKLFSQEEQNQISCLLLLDLYDVCSRITSEDIPVNLMVNIMKKIKSGCIYNNLLLKAKYGLIEKIEYDANFYDLEGVIDLVENKCNEDIFFNYLGEVIRKSANEPMIIKAIKKILSSYKNKKIQVDKCIELFKEIQEIDIPNNELEEGFINFCAAFS